MMTVFLCDDQPAMLDKYSDWVMRCAAQNQIEVALSTFQSGNELLFHLYDQPSLPDLIYLDILMDDLTGIEVGNQLRALGSQSLIIFLTTSEDYVFDSWDAMPIHYLLKNSITFEKFAEVFLRAVNHASKHNEEMFLCKAKAEQKMIPIHDIRYFEIWKGRISVHYGAEEPFQYWLTMEELEAQLEGKHFARIHRSYMVNLYHVASFQRSQITLKDGRTLPVGKTYEKKIKAAFAAYLAQKKTVRPSVS